MTEREPLVSVIIPTLNSERFLEQCLSSLKRQTHKNIEVVVVDDGSTDRTIEIAKRFGCSLATNYKEGRAEAKNAGIWEAHGDFLFFADSDMEFSENVIADCVTVSQTDPVVGGVVVPERSIGQSFWVKVRDFERSFYAGSVVESARFFPAEIAKMVGGFEEDLVFFEESTLPFKLQELGFNVHVRVKSMISHHEDNFSLSSWLQKKAHYGETIRRYHHVYSDYSAKQIGFRFRLGLFLKDWRRFWGEPKLAIGTLFLKIAEYAAVTYGSFSSRQA